MRPFIGSRDRAENLRIAARAGEGAHRPSFAVRRLLLKRSPIDGPAIETRRRTCLEPPHRKVGIAHLHRQTVRRALAYPPTFEALLAAKKDTAEKSPGAQNDGGRAKPLTTGEFETDNAPSFKAERRGLTRNQLQQRLRAHQALNRAMKQFAIRLHPGSPNGAALRAVEHPVVDCSRIRSTADDPIERVHLADEMPLPQPTDCRVATHRPNLVEVESDEACPRTHPRGSTSCLDTGMAAPDYKNIKIAHSARALLNAAAGVKATCFTWNTICRCRTVRTVHRAFLRWNRARPADPTHAGRSSDPPPPPTDHPCRQSHRGRRRRKVPIRAGAG